MNLIAYHLLTTATRGEPCLEYPGVWTVYADGVDVGEYTVESEAWRRVREMSDSDSHVSLTWGCSENDPRVGQVWFTGFYSVYDSRRRSL